MIIDLSPSLSHTSPRIKQAAAALDPAGLPGQGAVETDRPLFRPLVDPDAWVAPNAVLAGAVRLRAGASVWYGCVLRADGDQIDVGAGSNLQDLTIVHADPGRPVQIGAGVTIGHRAVLHGCTIGDGALIGMGAIVLNHATIGAGSLVGAGALVPEGMDVPASSLVLGAPARIRRSLTEAEQARLRANAAAYLQLTAVHRGALQAGDDSDARLLE